MVEELRVEVPGKPVPKQRARRDPRTGHWFTPKRTRDYEETVAWAFRARGACAWVGGQPVAVKIVLHFKKPVGDADNYAKSILDGMEKAGVFDNDRLVRELDVRFVINPTAAQCAVVFVRPLKADDPL